MYSFVVQNVKRLGRNIVEGSGFKSRREAFEGALKEVERIALMEGMLSREADEVLEFCLFQDGQPINPYG